MAGRFSHKKLSDISLDDPFFDSLKEDYPPSSSTDGFVDWFARKARDGASALTFDDDEGIGAFILIKEREKEPLILTANTLPAVERDKISTFRIAPRYQGQRLGEGALGLVLWEWQERHTPEIYVTVYPHHIELIRLFERFGFSHVGDTPGGERVYLRNRINIDFTDAYTSFPFIHNNFEYGGYLVIEDKYHDSLFAYSELAHTVQEKVNLHAKNGLTKVYVGNAFSQNHYIGEPVFIYRKFNRPRGSNEKPRYKSCLTSFCVVTDIIQAKLNYQILYPETALLTRIGNKSVFDHQYLSKMYRTSRNVQILEMVYYGYFGAGNNVNMDWLDNNGLWTTQNQYPTERHLNQNEFRTILRQGKIDDTNVIVH